jgi:predicted small metal-binding protein
MAKAINCACGETIRGETEDEVLDNAEEHVRMEHAEMADQFPRETLAGMVVDE